MQRASGAQRFFSGQHLGSRSAVQNLIRSIKPTVVMSDRSYLPGNELLSFILIVNMRACTPPKSTVTRVLERFFLSLGGGRNKRASTEFLLHSLTESV